MSSKIIKTTPDESESNQETTTADIKSFLQNPSAVISGSGQSTKDYYGFSKDFEYDRRVDYPVKKPRKNLTTILLFMAIGFGVIVVGAMVYLTIWLAWNQFSHDPIWLKIIKTWLSVIFAPVFLFYIFIKTVIFKLPN